MKARSMFLTLAFCVIAAVASFASDPNLGSWKLNEAKSKIPAGVSKNTSVVYTADGDNLKAVVDGVDPSGNPTHHEWTGKFDGKDYPVTGDPNTDTRAISKIGENQFELVNKKNGKTTVTGTIVTSSDGMTRTLTTHSTNAAGKKVSATFIYDKQ